MTLTFHGGVGSVTGANYLLESGGTKILVDCGLVQGSRFAERKNFEPFPYDPKEIEGVFVTHAHIDHTGRVPRLVKEGFTGTVYSTPPTMEFARELLLDSEHLLRETAEEIKKPYLYGPDDILKAMEQWEGIPYYKEVKVGNFTVSLINAGHILGSSCIKVSADGRTIVFSGDLGNFPAPIIKETDPLPETDYCVIESTYGDRTHKSEGDERRIDLERAIEETVARGGVLMIPAFSMERTQDLLYMLHQLFEERRIPSVPVFMDSPLAYRLTEIYKRYSDYFDEESSAHLDEKEGILGFPELRFTVTTEESKGINEVPAPKIIIAGSGMSNGGRILHHERRYLRDPHSTLLIVGYQGRGTLGRSVLDGASHVTIFGEKIPVRAKVKEIHSYSAHADQPRLLGWLAPRKKTLRRVFVTQGEDGSEPLRKKIEADLEVKAVIPEEGSTVDLA